MLQPIDEGLGLDVTVHSAAGEFEEISFNRCIVERHTAPHSRACGIESMGKPQQQPIRRPPVPSMDGDFVRHLAHGRVVVEPVNHFVQPLCAEVQVLE